MDASEIIEAIRSAKKKTPVKAYIKASKPLSFENCHVFTGADMVVIGDYADIEPVIEANPYYFLIVLMFLGAMNGQTQKLENKKLSV